MRTGTPRLCEAPGAYVVTPDAIAPWHKGLPSAPLVGRNCVGVHLVVQLRGCTFTKQTPDAIGCVGVPFLGKEERMAVHIRLRRIGKNPKKNPFFRVSVFDHRRSRDGKIIEEIGFYNPVTGKASLKKDRLEYWVTKGAQPSATVKSLLKKMGKGAENAAASA